MYAYESKTRLKKGKRRTGIQAYLESCNVVDGGERVEVVVGRWMEVKVTWVED